MLTLADSGAEWHGGSNVAPFFVLVERGQPMRTVKGHVAMPASSRLSRGALEQPRIGRARVAMGADTYT